MSEENVAIVRQVLNLWIEVDEGLADLDRMYEFFAPDAVSAAPDQLMSASRWRDSWVTAKT
jgi:hypothetical protein